MVTSNVALSTKLLQAYTRLLAQWASIEWGKVLGRTLLPPADGGEPSHTTAGKSLFVFHEVDRSLDYLHAIHQLVRCVESSAVTAMQVHGDSSQLCGAILSFFETVGQLRSVFQLPFTVPPRPPVVYSSLLSPCAAVVSRAGGLLVEFRGEFTLLQNVDPAEEDPELLSFENGLEQVPIFNNYVLDYCNSLWRHKAFEESENTTLFKMNPDAVSALKAVMGLKQGLSITHATPWISSIRKYLEELCARSAQPPPHLSPAIVKEKLKVDFLDHLERKGFKGLHQFLCTFISSLVSHAKA